MPIDVESEEERKLLKIIEKNFSYETELEKICDKKLIGH